MTVTIVRDHPEEDRVDENAALIEAVFAEPAGTQPDGLRDAAFGLGDGSFVHIADIEGENPLAATPAPGPFTSDLADRCRPCRGPDAQSARVIGSSGS